jgi:hypothetical protein
LPGAAAVVAFLTGMISRLRRGRGVSSVGEPMALPTGVEEVRQMGSAFCRLLLGIVLVTWLPLMAAPGEASAAPMPTGDRISGPAFLTENQPIAGLGSEFRRIKADGANTVSFDVWWVVPSYSASKVNPLHGLSPWTHVTDTDADLLAATQEARSAGLQVTLTPKVVVGQNGGYVGWRGYYNPPDPASFFASYETMINHYASLAQQAGISIFMVGSEMMDSDQYIPYWRNVITAARQRFSGTLGYEVDWREISKFDFGNLVDVLLLSAYPPTSNEEHPSLDQLKAGWHSYQYPGQTQTHDAFSAIANLAQRWKKPITFGEAGYAATAYTAQEPWWNKPEPPDPQSQYLAYQALLQTFAGQPWWGGVLWWAWNNGPLRSPEGKPAERLIGAQCVAGPSNHSGAVDLCNHVPVVAAGTHHASYDVSPRTMGAIALGVLVVAGIASALEASSFRVIRRRRRRPRRFTAR